jgi:hypothetical protein
MKTMITLYADEGKVLTHGTDYGTTVELAEGLSSEGWYEITEEEHEKMLFVEGENND